MHAFPSKLSPGTDCPLCVKDAHCLIHIFNDLILVSFFFSHFKCLDKANFALGQEGALGRANPHTGSTLAFISHFLESALIVLMR